MSEPNLVDSHEVDCRMYMFIEDEFDNMLVRQKDKILQMVWDGKYSQARESLELVRELWAECGYDYKTREIEEIMGNLG